MILISQIISSSNFSALTDSAFSQLTLNCKNKQWKNSCFFFSFLLSFYFLSLNIVTKKFCYLLSSHSLHICLLNLPFIQSIWLCLWMVFMYNTDHPINILPVYFHQFAILGFICLILPNCNGKREKKIWLSLIKSPHLNIKLFIFYR